MFCQTILFLSTENSIQRTPNFSSAQFNETSMEFKNSKFELVSSYLKKSVQMAPIIAHICCYFYSLLYCAFARDCGAIRLEMRICAQCRDNLQLNTEHCLRLRAHTSNNKKNATTFLGDIIQCRLLLRITCNIGAFCALIYAFDDLRSMHK